MNHIDNGQNFDSKKQRNTIIPHKERGVVAIIVALSMVVLVGFVGLALDLGKLFVTKTELQNSADACALAAARELAGANNNQLVLAEAAGIAAGGSNNVMFQGDAVNVVGSDVTFSDALNGSYLTKEGVANALDMRFVRCTVDRTDIPNWFMQVLGIGDQDVNATAVASLVPGQTTCAIPAGICTANVATAVPGDWIAGALGANNGELTGGFKWIDFTPPGGGTPELEAYLTGNNCSLPAVGSIVGEGGVKASLAQGWNTRFGIYHNSFKSPYPDPDHAGYAYTEINWPTKSNAFGDLTLRRSTNAAYQGDASTGLNAEGGGYVVKDSVFLSQYGVDRRLATVAVVDCDALNEGAPTTTVDAWACVMMLHPLNFNQGGGGSETGTGADRMYIEYLGLSNDPNSPCATSGAVGGATSIGPLVPALVQ